jgi:hypothetical protein
VGPKSVETSVGDLHNLKTDTGQITDSLALATETSDEDLVILINEGQTTILGHEAGNTLVVLLELNTDALTDSRVGLLGFDTDLFDNDTGSVGASLERLAPLGGLMGKFIFFIGPAIESAFDAELATSIDTSRFMASHLLLK